MASVIIAVPPDQQRERLRAAIEARDIHLASCRYRAQGLVCSTCTDVAERAIRAEAATVREPVEQLVIVDGVVSWSRAA